MIQFYNEKHCLDSRKHRITLVYENYTMQMTFRHDTSVQHSYLYYSCLLFRVIKMCHFLEIINFLCSGTIQISVSAQLKSLHIKWYGGA